MHFLPSVSCNGPIWQSRGLRMHKGLLLLGTFMFWIWKPGAVSHISQLFCCLKSGCETLFTLRWTPARGGLVLADGGGAEARRFLLRPDEALIAPLPGSGSTAFSTGGAVAAGGKAVKSPWSSPRDESLCGREGPNVVLRGGGTAGQKMSRGRAGVLTKKNWSVKTRWT